MFEKGFESNVLKTRYLVKLIELVAKNIWRNVCPAAYKDKKKKKKSHGIKNGRQDQTKFMKKIFFNG